jgi:glycine dehydrogenase subunit 1
MMARLTGMQVSNASLYDGASALAEAALMAVRAHRARSRAHAGADARCTRTIARCRGHRPATRASNWFEPCPTRRPAATARIDALRSLAALQAGEDVTALVIQQPNFFGVLEDVDALTDWAHAQGALVIAVVNPTSLALLKPPGEWGAKGADIVVGDGQPLGVPLASGRPVLRLHDLQAWSSCARCRAASSAAPSTSTGKPGFTLTLQAREQHIRRGKATSNICTNQGLLMTAATIYLSLMGPEGWRASPRPRQRTRNW